MPRTVTHRYASCSMQDHHKHLHKIIIPVRREDALIKVCRSVAYTKTLKVEGPSKKRRGRVPPYPPAIWYPCVTPPVSIGGEAPPLVLWDPWDEVRREGSYALSRSVVQVLGGRYGRLEMDG